MTVEVSLRNEKSVRLDERRQEPVQTTQAGAAYAYREAMRGYVRAGLRSFEEACGGEAA